MAVAAPQKVVVVIQSPKIERITLDGLKTGAGKSAKEEWEKTIAKVMWDHPAFSHVFLTMMADGKEGAWFTRSIPIAATDGKRLLLNPDTFFNYTLNKRVFICVHEIMHCIFDHCGMAWRWHKRGKIKYNDGVELPYDHGTMNKAEDYVINDALISAQVGEFDKDWLHAPQIATKEDSAMDAYRKLYKQGKGPGRGGQQDNPGGNQKGFDEHLAPGTAGGKDPTAAQQERNEQEWKQQVEAGIAVAKAQGKFPAGLERVLGEMLNPRVDWKDKIRALMARKLGTGARSFRRFNRQLAVRDIYAPGKSGFGCGDVVVGVDTSGSIGPKELDMFMAEMAGILEDCRPKRLFIMWCDAHVGRVDECEEVSDLMALRSKGAPGGGGTSFVPVFDEITKRGIEPDALVYLTDGMGSFPQKAPPYSVVWGSIYEQSKYPFGEVVNIPKQA